MIAFAIMLTLGAIIVQSSAELPSATAAVCTALLGALSWLLRPIAAHVLASRRRHGTAARSPELEVSRVTALRGIGTWLFTGVVGLAVGYGWSAWRAIERFSNWLDPKWETADVQLQGVIADLPQPFDGGVRVVLDVERALPRKAVANGLVLLTWYNGWSSQEFTYVGPVRGGERWRFTARLRRPHGNANPFGFDYESALLESGVVAIGTVRPTPQSLRIEAQALTVSGVIAGLREAFRKRLWGALDNAPYRGIITALAIGDQQAISNEMWREFNRTGISHLMSISGLHITMFAALAASAAGFLWRRMPNMALIVPAQKIAAFAGVAAAGAYCALAGFGVPAQRTFYMLASGALALLCDRWHSPAKALAVALAVVEVIDPWAALTAGFWLSFCAVGVLFYACGHVREESRLRVWVRAQCAVTVGLAPLTLAIFNQISLVGPLVNAVAIPFVSLLVTPLALIAAVCPYDGFARLAHFALACAMPRLEWVSHLPHAVWAQHAPPPWSIVLAALGALWTLAPRGIPGRCVGMVLMAPMFFVGPCKPTVGTAWIDILDVGQGLAVVVRTHSHTLLYDPGPRYGPGSDAGQRVVVPYLQAVGVHALDRLIVTHLDADHSGGLHSVTNALPTALLESSLDEERHTNAEVKVKASVPCYAGQTWQDDGIRFEFLHPSLEDYEGAVKRSNAMSCVLRVATSKHSVLLTADIEAREEARLVARLGKSLHADAMLVPHHGSRTSSTTAFLESVHPEVAIVSAGYHNRFGHPRAEVVRRYQQRGIRILRTDRGGAITIELADKGLRLSEFRKTKARYYRSVPH